MNWFERQFNLRSAATAEADRIGAHAMQHTATHFRVLNATGSRVVQSYAAKDIGTQCNLAGAPRSA
jgi:hypothetical protein